MKNYNKIMKQLEEQNYNQSVEINRLANENETKLREIQRLRHTLNLIAICTYENYGLSDVVKIAKDVLKSPDVSEDQNDQKDN